MIKITNLSKKYKNEEVLKNLSLELPRYGLISLCGPSGCGKTTILNCLAGLLPFNGSIEIDGRQIEKMNDNEKSFFRLKNIGFVFQDFKLFESQKVIENVSFPLKTLTNFSDKKIERQCRDILDIVDLKNYDERVVASLSGGEKQRVSIARAFINNPKLILADEPTGSLDNVNSENIMAILKNLSKKSLILVVTHDEELAKKYSNQIIYLQDGMISNIETFNQPSIDEFLPVGQFEQQNKKASIPLKFVFKHIKQTISFKKIRSSISFIFMSLGLLGIGLSIAFSSSISKDIKRAYSDVIESSEISLNKRENETPVISAVSYIDALDLKKNYKDIDDVGIIYQNNFEAFFKDENELNCVIGDSHYLLEGFSARTINEFLWIEEIKTEIYPEIKSDLTDSEVILGLNINQIRSICYLLQIEKSVLSLSNYLENHSIPIVFSFANDSWEYWDQQSLDMVGFCLTKECFIASQNPLWNEEMFEERMRFPNDEKENPFSKPWILKKLTYIQTRNPEAAVKSLREDKENNDLLFDLCDKKYYPVRFLNYSPEEIEKLVIYYGNDCYLKPNQISYVQNADDNIENEVIYNSTYVNYPNNLLSGFAHKTYFSFDEKLLNETIENNSSLKINDNEIEVLPKQIVSSDFSCSLNNPVRFSSKIKNLLSGREPIDLDEIVISKGLYDELYQKDLATDYLNMITVTKEISEDYGIFVREYCTNKIKIVGITDSNKLMIYHNPYWTIDFYLLRLGISFDELLPNCLSYSFIDEKKQEKTIEKLETAFPKMEIINPLIDINNSVDELCKIISVFVLCIAMISLVISLILLLACNYLYLQDSKKDIALTRCLGASKKESLKFLYGYSFISGGISLIISIFELVLSCLLIGFVTSGQLFLSFKLNIDPFAILAMIIVSILISILSSIIFGNKVGKIEPSECLRV